MAIRHHLKVGHGTALVVEWIRFHLPFQEIRFNPWVQEDPTWFGATKIIYSRAHMPQLLSPHDEIMEPLSPRDHDPQQERRHHNDKPCDSPGKNTGVGCHAPLQGIFQTQRSNVGFLHCRRNFAQWEACSSQLENSSWLLNLGKIQRQQWRLSAAKINK